MSVLSEQFSIVTYLAYIIGYNSRWLGTVRINIMGFIIASSVLKLDVSTLTCQFQRVQFNIPYRGLYIVTRTSW